MKLFAGSSQTKNYSIFPLLIPNFVCCGFCLPPPLTTSHWYTCILRSLWRFFFNLNPSSHRLATLFAQGREMDLRSIAVEVIAAIEKSYSVSHGFATASHPPNCALTGVTKLDGQRPAQRHNRIIVISIIAVAVRERNCDVLSN